MKQNRMSALGLRWDPRVWMRSLGQYLRLHGIWGSLFVSSFLAMLLFWALMQWLADRLGMFPYFFAAYLWSLLGSLGIGAVVYIALVWLPRRGWMGKILANGLLVLIFLTTALLSTVNILSALENMNDTEYFSESYSSEVVIDKMIVNRRFWGQGESIFQYPQALADAYDAENSDMLPFEVQQAHREREKAEDAMWNVREGKLLIVLSYAYGGWMILVLFVIAAVWCVSGVRIYLDIYSRWFEWVYLICFTAAAYQTVLPVLMALGIMPESGVNFSPFYSGDAAVMSLLLTIPIAAMLAIRKQNNDAT